MDGWVKGAHPISPCRRKGKVPTGGEEIDAMQATRERNMMRPSLRMCLPEDETSHATRSSRPNETQGCKGGA
eukprot:scaffold320_cov335-Pavlova_lutheri.AAC.10